MTTVTYSTKLREMLDGLRPAFRDMSQGLAVLTRRRIEIAPSFMAAFRVWRRETKRPFIAFVHELDPTVPVSHRTAYRQHPAYRAACYLQQLAEEPTQGRARGVTPLTMLAVTIKSLLPLCHPHEQAALELLTKACRWRDRDVRHLLGRIAKAKALPLPKAPRLRETAKVSTAAVLAFQRERVA